MCSPLTPERAGEGGGRGVSTRGCCRCCYLYYSMSSMSCALIFYSVLLISVRYFTLYAECAPSFFPGEPGRMKR